MLYPVSGCIVLALSLICTSSAIDDSNRAYIVRQEEDIGDKGVYKFSFETSDGIAREEHSELKQEGTEYEFLKVRGSFSYTGPDGVKYLVKYVADDQGFHPEGDHIKVPPFTPWVPTKPDQVHGNGDYSQESRSFEDNLYPTITSGQSRSNHITPSPVEIPSHPYNDEAYPHGENPMNDRPSIPKFQDVQYEPEFQPKFSHQIPSSTPVPLKTTQTSPHLQPVERYNIPIPESIYPNAGLRDLKSNPTTIFNPLEDEARKHVPNLGSIQAQPVPAKIEVPEQQEDDYYPQKHDQYHAMTNENIPTTTESNTLREAYFPTRLTSNKYIPPS